MQCSNLDTVEECNSSTDVSFPPLSQTKVCITNGLDIFKTPQNLNLKSCSIIISQISQDAHKTHEEVSEEDHGQDTAQNPSLEEVSDMFFAEPNWEGAIYNTEQFHRTGPEDQIMVPFK